MQQSHDWTVQKSYDWATRIQRILLYNPPDRPIMFTTPRYVSKGTAIVIDKYVCTEQLALKMIHDMVPNNDFEGTISQLVAEFALDSDWIMFMAYPDLQADASLVNYDERASNQFPKGDYRRYEPDKAMQKIRGRATRPSNGYKR